MKVAQEIFIPASHARAFQVKQGQVFRIFPLEDGQVGDCVFYNAHDYKEWFHVGQTWTYNTSTRRAPRASSASTPSRRAKT